MQTGSRRRWFSPDNVSHGMLCGQHFYKKRLVDAGSEPSVCSVGDSCDNAPVEMLTAYPG
jgi:hypothetical protein